MNAPQETRAKRISTIVIVAAIIVSLLMGGLLGYVITYSTISGKIADLQNQLSALPNQNITYFLDRNVSLSQLYDQVKDSVVVIRGLVVQYVFNTPYYSEVQGSGFVYNFTGQMVVITNYHVVQKTASITLTFADGDGYAAKVLGYDPYEDLAILSADAPQNEWKPLRIAHSSTLEVGDPVIAVGSPYGLAGSMTTGIVSALGRTLTEDMTGGYSISSVIQTSTPINPGNSGGPLLNYQGRVVGITTAIVSDSQGLGFAVPSDAILREIESLVTKGSYDQHPWLGATGTDMTYEIASKMGVSKTYGWLIVQVISGSPAASAGLQGGTQQVQIGGTIYTIGGDVIIAINGNTIINGDALFTYLEENTQPGQTINLTIIRNQAETNIDLTLGTRPAPSV